MEVMYSNSKSHSNSLIKLFHRRHDSIVTTSDVGESLYDDDDNGLEWDESDFTRHLPESDALSSYDVNEMAEILRNHFLEFDMSSQIGKCSILSRQSTLSDTFTPISNQDLNIEQFINNSSSNENQIIKRPFHRSLSDFKTPKQRSFPLSKHLSLMDIKSIEWTFLKNPTSREITLTKANSRRSVCSIPHSMEIEFESVLFNSTTDMNFSRLSKFAMIRLYIMKFTEKFSSLLSQTFRSKEIPVITENIIDSYDIIEE